MNTQVTYPQRLTPAPQASWRVKPVPRLPRQQRQPAAPPSQYSQAVSVLRQKTQELILKAVESGVSQDALLFEQITAEAGAFNTAAVWLATQGYPEGVQTDHPLVA
jgi:hypothetical protein